MSFGATKGWSEALISDDTNEVRDKMKADAMNFLTLSLCSSAFLCAEISEEPKEIWPSDDMDAYNWSVNFGLCKLNTEMEK